MRPGRLEKASSKSRGFYVTRMALDGGELFGDPFLHFARDTELWSCVPRKSFQYIIAILQRRRGWVSGLEMGLRTMAYQ